MAVEKHVLNDKVAYTYGPLALATDEQKSGENLKTPIDLKGDICLESVTPLNGEIVRFENKNTGLIFADLLIEKNEKIC